MLGDVGEFAVQPLGHAPQQVEGVTARFTEILGTHRRRDPPPEQGDQTGDASANLG
jgi:hypothetical protein